jgi:hypothetical protein
MQRRALSVAAHGNEANGERDGISSVDTGRELSRNRQPESLSGRRIVSREFAVRSDPEAADLVVLATFDPSVDDDLDRRPVDGGDGSS